MLLMIISCSPEKTELLDDRAYWVESEGINVGWFDTEFHDYKYENDNFCFEYDTSRPGSFSCYPLKSIRLILIEEGKEPY